MIVLEPHIQRVFLIEIALGVRVQDGLICPCHGLRDPHVEDDGNIVDDTERIRFDVEKRHIPVLVCEIEPEGKIPDVGILGKVDREDPRIHDEFRGNNIIREPDCIAILGPQLQHRDKFRFHVLHIGPVRIGVERIVDGKNGCRDGEIDDLGRIVHHNDGGLHPVAASSIQIAEHRPEGVVAESCSGGRGEVEGPCTCCCIIPDTGQGIESIFLVLELHGGLKVLLVVLHIRCIHREDHGVRPEEHIRGRGDIQDIRRIVEHLDGIIVIWAHARVRCIVVSHVEP